MARSLSGKEDSAVENLLSQAKDLYVLEQVAKVNCSGFTDDYALPTSLETRFRRLKSLPVSGLDPVSSSKKFLSHSKSMASYPEKKNRRNVSSASAFSSFSGNLTGKTCPLDSSVGNKRDTNVNSGFEKNSRGGLGDFSNSGRIGYSSSKRINPKFLTPTIRPLKLIPREKSRITSSSFTSIDLASSGFENSRGGFGTDSRRIGSSSSSCSQQGKILTPATQTLNFFPKENSRTSSYLPTSIELASPSSDHDRKEGMKQKPTSKSKFIISWFDQLSIAQAMGCLQGKSLSNSRKTKESCKEESKQRKQM